MAEFESVLLFGCGNMAGAMLRGWVAGGVDPAIFTVVNRSEPELPPGVHYAAQVPAGKRFDMVQIGVKPQALDSVVGALAPACHGAMVVSILAGTRLDALARRFPQARCIVRAMPNLAVELGKSPIALAADGASEGDCTLVERFMRHLGTPEWVAEDAFDLVTALAGSGPAFVYRFIAGLFGAGEALGLPAEQAQRLALAMTEGAAALAARSPHDPAELARRVASPGGVTQAGLDILDDDGALASLLLETLRAARDRSAGMAQQGAEASLPGD